MKLCLILISSFFPLLCIQNSIYDFQVETISGKIISLSDYKGKRIIITEFGAAMVDKNQLQYLDSIHKANNGAAVIAIPALDFGGTANEKELIRLQDSLGLRMLITKPAYVKKAAGKQQLELFKWLTDVNGNRHFDYEVEEPWQLFIINNEGVMYSLLKKVTPRNVFNEALTVQVKE